ncbi:MAG: extracellular solute-binding protein [Caldilineaceae bacterium]
MSTRNAYSWLYCQMQPVACRLLGIGLVLFLGLAACAKAETALNPTATPTPGSLATPTLAPIVTADSKVNVTTEHQLVIWAPPFFDAQPDANAGNILHGMYRQFEQANPGVHVDVHIKAEMGETSMFNYLRSAQRVAPTILPDIVLIDTQYLWQIVELDLVHPITLENLGPKLSFYPFAVNAVTFKQQQYGIPYVADVIHAVYASNVYTTTPTTWAPILATKRPFLFPAGLRDGFYDDSLLVQYVGAGAQLLENGEVSNPEAVTAFLTFLTQAKSAGVIPDDALTLSNLDAAWAEFLSGQVNAVNTSASLYLGQPKPVDTPKFGPVPTLKGANVTIARTWALAILTNDAQRRQLAMQLITRFLEPSLQGRWSQLANRLPTSANAFTQWPATDPYHQFLRRELDVALAIPNGRPFAEFAKHLQTVQQAVLHGQLTVKDAVTQLRTKP